MFTSVSFACVLNFCYCVLVCECAENIFEVGFRVTKAVENRDSSSVVLKQSLS